MTPDTWPAAITAIPLGIGFGVVLERAGLGDPRVIAGQLTGHDFTVVRVMLGAIVTAMLGVVWLGAAGVVDPGTIAIPPTDVAAQALGAMVFGVGFALAALCPGTACVAASSGRRDGLAAVAGMFAGTAILPAVWPVVGGSAAATPREGARLPEDLHWPLWVVVLAITLLGVVASMIARRAERRTAGQPWWRPATGEAMGLTLALAFVAVDAPHAIAPARLAIIAGEIAREDDHVDPLDLAEWVKARRPGLRVIDVRENIDDTTYRIPGAESLPLDRLARLRVQPGDHVVLYSDGGTHAAQAWVLLRSRGLTDVKVLKDGLAAWEDEVLLPAPPLVASDTAQRRFQRARKLALWFGGHPTVVPRATAPGGSPAAPRKRRRKTC